MQTFNELQNESVQDPLMEIEVPESKELNEDVKMKRNPLKRTSKRLQTKTAQSKKASYRVSLVFATKYLCAFL